MIGVEDCVGIEKTGLAYHLENNAEALLVAVKKEGVNQSQSLA